MTNLETERFETYILRSLETKDRKEYLKDEKANKIQILTILRNKLVNLV